MKQRRRIASAALAVTMLSATLIACSKAAEPGSKGNGGSSSPVAAGSSGQTVTYPLKADKTLTYWTKYTTVKPTASDIPFFQELQKRTGVPLKFITPPVGQEKDALNVLLASGDLPDIIEWDWFSFPGGPEKAIADGYILKLNDVIDKYAPNLKKYLKEHPEVDKFVYPFIQKYFVKGVMIGALKG